MIDFGEESSIDNFFVDDTDDDLKLGGLLGFLTGEACCPICGEEEIEWHMGTSYYWCPVCEIDFFQE